MQDWLDLLADKLPTTYWAEVQAFLDQAYGSGLVYPARERVFASLEATSYEAVKVVILGQDPYHGPNQAQGLSFSVPESVPAPPSLRNILKELATDVGERPHHDLTAWAEQGVLLLNSVLTVPAGQANGHAALIWEPLTDAIISLLNQKSQPVVFILWGGFAQKKATLIRQPQHLVLKAPHPSPLSSYRGFFGSQPFSKTNTFLTSQGLAPIDWLA